MRRVVTGLLGLGLAAQLFTFSALSAFAAEEPVDLSSYTCTAVQTVEADGQVVDGSFDYCVLSPDTDTDAAP